MQIILVLAQDFALIARRPVPACGNLYPVLHCSWPCAALPGAGRSTRLGKSVLVSYANRIDSGGDMDGRVRQGAREALFGIALNGTAWLPAPVQQPGGET